MTAAQQTPEPVCCEEIGPWPRPDAPIGARDVAVGGTSEPLAAAVRDVIAEVLRAVRVDRPDRIVGCGMLTSEVGLASVPHVVAPAGLHDLARGAVQLDRPDIAPLPILLVPGVRTPTANEPEGWARADVMRGEECEAIGLWRTAILDGQAAATPGQRCLFVLPGSHTKLVVLDVGTGGVRIEASHTTLAGELLAALARHTILAASLPVELPRKLDPDAVATGARLVRTEGLGRAAFLVRVAALTRDWNASQRASFLIGAVAAEDVAHLLRQPTMGPASKPIVIVGGPDPLRSLYTRLMGEHVPVRGSTTEHASALGAALVANHCE